MGSLGERMCGKVVYHMGEAGVGGSSAPTFVHAYARRNKERARQTAKSRVYMRETKDSKPLVVKSCGRCEGGRKSPSYSPLGKVHGVLEHKQTDRHGN